MKWDNLEGQEHTAAQIITVLVNCIVKEDKLCYWFSAFKRKDRILFEIDLYSSKYNTQDL